MEAAEPAHRRQKWWAEQVGKQRILKLLDNASPRDQARLLEQAGGLGTCFMGVIPNTNLFTLIPSDTYRLALRWWLGMPILEHTPETLVTCPGCLAPLDVFGDHLLCCPRNNFNRRHAAV
jgi:hypothetical protein